MADVNYTYNLIDFLNGKVDISKLDMEIRASDITASLAFVSVTETHCTCWFRNTLGSKDLDTLAALVATHDGIEDEISDIQYVSIKSSDIHLPIDLMGEYRDRSGKLRVHQTSRKLGTMILWTGEGDNPNVPDSIGGGERLAINYVAGGSEPLVKYIDFNCTSTETWIHEGYITWYGALLDTLDLQIVNRVTSTVSGTGTNYNLYGGYLIVPAVPGTGTLQVTSDITTSTGGLVYMPLNDIGVRTPSFWNADWNSSVKRFENITAAPSGDGEYNMFATELVLSQVIRSMNLIDRGFIAMNSSDVDELGNGMRLRFTADINTSIRDHDLLVACTLCLHRSRSVANSVFI